MDYDVIVVGGRCAGASVATFLARAGARVLVLERAKLPSDQVLSTHAVRPRGMDVLDLLGVGDAVRSAPATRVLRIRKNDVWIDSRYPDGRTEHAPRRLRLDALLAGAARGAGAELEDGALVRGLTFDGTRVTGVRVRRAAGEITLRAGLVIGADGRHSLVAKQVRAQEYLAYEGPRGMYWSYWERPAWLGSDSESGFDMYFAHVGHDMRIMYGTDDGLALIGYLPRLSELARFRECPEASLRAALANDEWIGSVVRAGRARERIRATSKERYFFREAAGPGWMLLGDAGLHKEFVTGDGITEALLQAERASAAIAQNEESARRRFWRERDVAALELFCFGRDLGTDGPAEKLDELVFARVARAPDLANRLALALDHGISPYESFPFSQLARTLGAAVCRGRFDVLPQFAARARRSAEVKRELSLRSRLLAACDG